MVEDYRALCARIIPRYAGETERQGAVQLLATTYEVLVVDDSPLYQRLVEQALSSGPYSLIFADNGKDALRLFHEREPSIVVSDWIMPDLTGLERFGSTPASQQN